MLKLSALGLTQGDKVLITPYTPMTGKLKRELQRLESVHFLGFVDKSKEGPDILRPSQLATSNYDKILVLSPNWGLDIFKALRQQGVPANRLQLLELLPEIRRISLLRHRLKKWFADFRPRLLKHLQHYVKPLLSSDSHVMLLSPNFVDLNIKETYLALDASGERRAIIASNRGPQLERLRDAGFKVVEIESLLFFWHCIRSCTVVMDHNPLGSLMLNAIIGSRLVQIWHGIPLKKIGHLANYKAVKYDIVVSTSPFVTEYAFAELFDARQILECGYPRNDVLANPSEDTRQLALVDQDIYQWAVKSGKRLVIYMPTWRGDSFETNPIDLDALNAFCQRQDLLIVMKMHPFISANTFFDTLESDQYRFTQNYPHNIVFYPNDADIYPLLARSDMLITDYSSVYFDYLLVNKPIVFFVYDLHQYAHFHGDFMLDFEQFTPGPKVFDFDKLKEQMLMSLQAETWEPERQTLRDKLFVSSTSGRSAHLLTKAIISVNEPLSSKATEAVKGL